MKIDSTLIKAMGKNEYQGCRVAEINAQRMPTYVYTNYLVQLLFVILFPPSPIIEHSVKYTYCSKWRERERGGEAIILLSPKLRFFPSLFIYFSFSFQSFLRSRFLFFVFLLRASIRIFALLFFPPLSRKSTSTFFAKHVLYPTSYIPFYVSI